MVDGMLFGFRPLKELLMQSLL